MNFSRGVAVLILAFFCAIAVRPCTIEALGDGTPRSRLHYAKAVFVGEVVEIGSTPRAQQEQCASALAVRFRVEQYWKGVNTKQITVHSDLTGCGPSFTVGKRYLVYARGSTLEAGPLAAQALQNAAADLRSLGPGKLFRAE
jgi:hypothetical protein